MRESTLHKLQATGAPPGYTTLMKAYRLLSLIFLTSMLSSVLSLFVSFGYYPTLYINIGLLVSFLFVLPKTARNAAGIYVVFVTMALLGLSVGPSINHYASATVGPEGSLLCFMFLVLVFFVQSYFVNKYHSHYNSVHGISITALSILLCLPILYVGFSMPIYFLFYPAVVALIIGVLIILDTSTIIKGFQESYVFAAVGVFLVVYDVFAAFLRFAGPSKRS